MSLVCEPEYFRSRAPEPNTRELATLLVSTLVTQPPDLLHSRTHALASLCVQIQRPDSE